MKKTKRIILIILILPLLLCFNSPVETNYQLPSFSPIKVDENTIMMTNFDTSEIYAVDTLNKRIFKTYNFKPFTFVDFLYDQSTDNTSSYLIIQGDKTELIKLDHLTGNTNYINTSLLNGIPNWIGFSNKKLFIGPLESNNDRYSNLIYDITTKEIKCLTLDGRFGGGCLKFNNESFIRLVNNNYEVDDLYNLTNNKNFKINIKHFLNSDDFQFQFIFPFKNNYAAISFYNIKTDNYYRYLYKINSLEPLECESITKESSYIANVFEDKEYIYIYSTDPKITKIKKDNYNIITYSQNLPEIQGRGSFLINGSLWCMNSGKKGSVLRVDCETLETEVIK